MTRQIEFHEGFIAIVLDELFDLPDKQAMKLKRSRGFDQLLCDHVYFGFCQDCPQYECKKRGI